LWEVSAHLDRVAAFIAFERRDASLAIFGPMAI
jgi:hypothetical protein